MGQILRQLFPEKRPVMVLAPMQDVTDLPFWKIMHQYGGPDIYFTEYFRVHQTSKPEKNILACIEQNPSDRPAIAQMIGQSIPDLVRTAEFLQTRDVAAIDLNVGCPAPIVCKKSSGGGLLRNLELLNKIITALRAAISIPFTVKTRLGFYETSEQDAILELLEQHDIDMLTLHGRTVKEMYRAHVHYDLIHKAVKRFDTANFPVIANGNVLSAEMAQTIHRATNASGWMIGRGAIRNPWIWNQIRELYEIGEIQTRPTLHDLREYIERLYRITQPPEIQEKYHVAKMKKYMNFIAQGVSPDDLFLQRIRRAITETDFFKTCDEFLNTDKPFEPEMPEGALVNAGRPRDDSY
ncbi:MAG: tRNA-dihydrouridine synthase family protein [Verrucomicrobiota bacterium]